MIQQIGKLRKYKKSRQNELPTCLLNEYNHSSTELCPAEISKLNITQAVPSIEIQIEFLFS